MWSGLHCLFFGYDVYELFISDIDPWLQDLTEDRRNILNINSLESLKQKLTNVIIIGFIIIAFKLTISFEVDSIVEVLQYCGCVLMLSFSAWLFGQNNNHWSHVNINCLWMKIAWTAAIRAQQVSALHQAIFNGISKASCLLSNV